MLKHKHILLIILGLFLVLAVSVTYAASKTGKNIQTEDLLDCPYNHDTSICPYEGDHDTCPFQNPEEEIVKPIIETNPHEGCPNAVNHGFLN